MKKWLYFIPLIGILFSCVPKNSEPVFKTGKDFIRGECLKTPVTDIPRFVNFIDNVLAPKGVNLLVLRINYSLEWISHPELNSSAMLKRTDAQKIIDVCKKDNIMLVPLINCLGHQSWGKNYGPLLKAYPEFEENPAGMDSLPDFYCRSYCPLSKVHDVLFDLFDEVIDLFHSKAFHVGMDEVFIIGSDSCKNGCAGQDKAKLFADEAIRLHNYLINKGVRMWIWGDRLIDGESTGLGKWQASMNGTYPAVDMIPKDILICDWHYKVAPPTAFMFASKGFDVVSCSHQVPEVAITQLNEMKQAQSGDADTSKHMRGVLHTFWGNTSEFMDAFEGKQVSAKTKDAYKTFIELSEKW